MSDKDRSYEDAERSLMVEMDVVEIIKKIRIIRMMTDIFKMKRQREIVKFFNDYTVGAYSHSSKSDSSASSSQDEDHK